MQAEAVMQAHFYHAKATQALEDLAEPMAACPPIANPEKDIHNPVIRAGEVPPNIIHLTDQIGTAPEGPPIKIGRKGPKKSLIIDGQTYVGGDTFENNLNFLPTVDQAGNSITYQEYDIKPYIGTNRGTGRIVIGTDGNRYFSPPITTNTSSNTEGKQSWITIDSSPSTDPHCRSCRRARQMSPT
jgi:hypothetical protein